MAGVLAIEATTRAIKKLITTAPVPVDISAVNVQLYQAKNLADPMTEGLSLYLYRVGFNLAQRNRAPRLERPGQRHKTPLAVDLFYLLTAWAGQPETQQRLLGWAMRVLEDTPILPAGLLNEDINREVFEPHETVELIPELVSIQDMNAIWEVAKQHQQPSAAYAVRMLMIDGAEEEGGVLVQTRSFDVGVLR